MFKDESFHQIGKQQHHQRRHYNGDKGVNMPSKMVILRAKDSIDQMRKGHLTFLHADKRHRREQRHHALCVIEDTRRLENQDKAQRDKRIHDAGHQTVNDNFEAVKKRNHDLKIPGLIDASPNCMVPIHVAPPDRHQSPPDYCAPLRDCRHRSCARNPSPPHGRQDPSPHPCHVRSAQLSSRIHHSHPE